MNIPQYGGMTGEICYVFFPPPDGSIHQELESDNQPAPTEEITPK